MDTKERDFLCHQFTRKSSFQAIPQRNVILAIYTNDLSFLPLFFESLHSNFAVLDRGVANWTDIEAKAGDVARLFLQMIVNVSRKDDLFLWGDSFLKID